jgi:hypothetical protein
MLLHKKKQKFVSRLIGHPQLYFLLLGIIFVGLYSSESSSNRYLFSMPQPLVYVHSAEINTEVVLSEISLNSSNSALDDNEPTLIRTGGQMIMVPLIMAALVVFISGAITANIKPSQDKKTKNK